MRKQFVSTVEELIEKDNRLVLLLGDIGVYGFRRSFEKYPDRVYNIGILEQSTVSVAAGLALVGLIPIVHTIAPFLVERSYEQLKIDLCYQKLGANLVSVGASYDYAALGSTHHCPGDVGILKKLPNMEIVLPGNSREFDVLFKQCYANCNPTYYRLSEKENETNVDITFGKANVLKQGSKATVITVSNTLDTVLEACKELDVTILYYTTISPFDYETLNKNCSSRKIIVIEPFYYGELTTDIILATKPHHVSIDYIGVPHEFLMKYGTLDQHDMNLGFNIENIRGKVLEVISG